MQAKELRAGESFEMVNLKNVMRNLVCLRVSPTAVHISGEEKESSSDTWKPIKDAKGYISGSTEVRPLDKPLVNVSKSDNNQLTTDRPKGKRGRASKNLSFPKNPFTIPDLADINSCSVTHALLKVQKMVKSGDIQIIEERRKEGARGRAQKVYQVSDIIYKSQKIK